MKERLDILLVERGYFSSREKAKAAVMAGLVSVDNMRCDKAGTGVNVDAVIEIKENLCPYVGRGGLKLKKAIDCFHLSMLGKTTLDIGASTGGFTDCMLKEGAEKVYAIDVGYGQLDWKLRNDSRVVNMEKTNIRYLDTDTIPDRMDFASADVSFISLNLVLPVASRLLKEGGEMVCLVKPQFEAGRQQVGKHGIVKDPEVHSQVIMKVMDYGKNAGFEPVGLTYSPMTGAKGNIEYLLLLQKSETGISGEDTRAVLDEGQVAAVIEEAHGSLMK